MNQAVRNRILSKFSIFLILSLAFALNGCHSFSGTVMNPGPSSDTTPPSAPTTFTVTAASATQINLSWSASTDNVAVTAYKVERCQGAGCSSFTQIAAPAVTTFGDSALTPSTSYSYRVRAADAAGNLSTYSSVATAATMPNPDTQPPTAPSALVATGFSSTQINLAWAASTDNVGVTGYFVERCQGASCSSFAQVASPGNVLSYNNTGLIVSTNYSYRVRATDAAGNLSPYSNIAGATTPDTTAPSAPATLTAAAISTTQINLTWTPSTDNVAVTSYLIERCQGASCSNFAQLASSATATFSDAALTAATSYSYRVRATDAAGNLSAYSGTARATTFSAPDTQPPTAPTNLVATATSGTQINLSWTASTDNVAVTGYKVESCQGATCSTFAQIAAPITTTYSNTGLSAATSYSYRVRATDAAGNLSAYSLMATATTLVAAPVSVAISPKRGGLTPSQPLHFTATVNNDVGSAGVTWSASSGSFTASTVTTATFSAPSTAGPVTVTATSIADSTQSASATIGVSDLSGVTTYHNDNSRTGANLKEYALTPANVNTATFGKLFSCAVDAAIYAQPLWLANQTISGSLHNVVFVATQKNSVFAFDADSATCQILWQNSLNPAGETWVLSADESGCGDLAPNIGIVGTPVIDPVTGTLYLVSKTKNTAGTVFHQRLHALDLLSGNEKFGGPVDIQATVSGTGGGSSGGSLSFDAKINGQRPALLLESDSSGKHVVISWASHCDFAQYHGWVISYNAGTLAREAIFNVSPNGVLGGIWMSGNGPAADATGNIFLATGNGNWTGTDAYGDSIVKLGPQSGGSFGTLDYFTPTNQAGLESGDIDLGSGGVLMLPDLTGPHPHLLVQVGKEGQIYVVNRDNLGQMCSGSCSTGDTQIVQELPGAINGMWGSPAYWNGYLYFGGAQDSGSGDKMKAFSVTSSAAQPLSSSPTTQSAQVFTFSGPTPSVSASGTTNAIVWALDNSAFGSSCPSSACQVVYAYDATNLGTLLYTSSQAAANRDRSGGAVKFTVPTVANGKVYVGGQTTITVYGLLPN